MTYFQRWNILLQLACSRNGEHCSYGRTKTSLGPCLQSSDGKLHRTLVLKSGQEEAAEGGSVQTIGQRTSPPSRQEFSHTELAAFCHAILTILLYTQYIA